MQRFYTFILFMLSATAVFAQHGRITGQILSSDGQPAEQVSVGIKGSSKGSISDAEGKFAIERVKPGTYSLLVSFVGLETQEKSVEVIAAETANVSFTLSESANQLQEVIIKGGNP